MRSIARFRPHPDVPFGAEVWSLVNRRLAGKALGELAHERLIDPQLRGMRDGLGRYVLACPEGVEWRFRAHRMALDHWSIEIDSIQRIEHGAFRPVEALALVLDLRSRLGIAGEKLPDYLEEVALTLYGAAYRDVHQRCSSKELVDASFQEIETAMTEGHPVFLANAGRIGFDAHDHRHFAPESAQPLSLLWIAVDRERATVATSEGLSYDRLLERELGEAKLAEFRGVLVSEGLSPEAYVWMPVHPWQWRNKLALAFASDLATRRIVLLGSSEDAYLPQQSIRTFFNVSRPERCYVKTALSIRNMGFVRGLSPGYMAATPAINDWVHARIEGDAELRSLGFSILREVAAVGYRNPCFEGALETGSPQRKMLAALWRESPVPGLRPGQRLATMSSLLHHDRDGVALLPELIRASGCTPDAWLTSYLRCYLRPILHCFFAHDLVFMPHGENLILVMEQHLPVRVLMKDVGEEVNLLAPREGLPGPVQRIVVSVPQDIRALSIFTDVFDCFFRFLAPILASAAGYPVQSFWRRVAECIRGYQDDHPELAPRFARHDLFAEEFARSCLNRLQLGDPRQMVDLTDPAKSLRLVGTLENPIAAWREPDHLPGWYRS